jgi:hypothetical protein
VGAGSALGYGGGVMYARSLLLRCRSEVH